VKWNPVLPGVWLFRDSCNVYALEGKDGLLVIDAGTGAWLSHLDELPQRPSALLCTHYFRDHAAGATAAAERSIPVYVPEEEQAIFTDPEQHFRERETYIINSWQETPASWRGR
jgi:glyoxylase-like metal-dependent hydrolase (beta-lactamase superfamily II)